jgi:hypothetical protein
MAVVSRLAILLLVGACSTAEAPLPSAAPPVVAPRPKEYTCDQQRAAAAEFERLPAGNILRTFIVDYGTLRAANRAALKLPEPAACR